MISLLIDESSLQVGLIAIHFNATWLPNSLKLKKTYLKLEAEFPEITFFTVDVDIVPVLVSRYSIENIPSTIVLYNGNILSKIEGVYLIAPLRTFFRKALKEKEDEIMVKKKSE